MNNEMPDAIAVIGMAGRFPGAANIEAFWRNLCDGVDATTFFSDEELLEAGVEPAILSDPNYIKAKPVLDGADLFDAGFFGYTPHEAEMIDPQQRVFLECARETLENAGYAPEAYDGLIGLFGGVAVNRYAMGTLFGRDLTESSTALQSLLGNDKDFLTTRRVVQAEPAGAERERAVRVLDFAGGGGAGLPDLTEL